MRAEVTAVDGRRVTFTVEATDAGGTVVGRGTVERVVVEAQRFLDRLDRCPDTRVSGLAGLQRVAERQPFAVLGERPLAEVAVDGHPPGQRVPRHAAVLDEAGDLEPAR